MKFSIILPTYNRAGTYLKGAIDSIVSQSYDNWELLIIDNHSEDFTDELIDNYKDHRIKTYKIHNNGNIAKSRNLGIKKSSGDYIALIDSDDFWHKDKLKISLEYLEKNKLNGLCHSEYWLYETGETETRHYGLAGFSYNNLLKNGNNLSLSAVIVHADILKDVKGFSEDIEYVTAEDYDLWLKLAKNNYKIKFIKNIMGTFRIHQYSESSDVDKNIKAICADYECDLNVEEDGKCVVSGQNQEKLEAAITLLEGYSFVPEVNKVYKGKVVKIMDFGAFVRIAPDVDGLVHISEIQHERTKKVEDFLKVDQEIDVKLIKKDDRGKLSLSIKALIDKK